MTQVEQCAIIVADLVKREFYGDVVFKFEAGKVVQIKKTESVKLVELMK